MEAWGCFNIVNEARCAHPASDIEGRSEGTRAYCSAVLRNPQGLRALRVLDRIRGETSGFALSRIPLACSSPFAPAVKKLSSQKGAFFFMVGAKGLEPLSLAAADFKSAASANSATLPCEVRCL